MGDFEQVYKMQEIFEGRLAIMLCDFTPLYIEKYYQELFSILKSKGTILATFPMAEFALEDGKYADISRESNQIAYKAHQVIQNNISKHSL